MPTDQPPQPDADSVYGVNRWSQGYVSINDRGHLEIRPEGRPERAIDLKQLVDDLSKRDIHPPVLLRFTDLMGHRIQKLTNAFQIARAALGFQGAFHAIYPIKVNQQRQVIEDLLRSGNGRGLGLEVGSKPELLAGLALINDDETPILCNGFKDEQYIETVMWASRLGRWIVPVVEKRSELDLMLRQANIRQVRPRIGIRVKLAQPGAGRWAHTGGDQSKFGLLSSEVLDSVECLGHNDMLDSLELLHFHLGSQVHDIARIKAAVTELARIYVELRKLGANVRYLDVGGGLAVDYDGSASATDSSMNYTLSEYANNVVYHIQSVCDDAGVMHPTIISESGRALSAYHSVLIFNVVGRSSAAPFAPPKTYPEDDLAAMPMPVRMLAETYLEIERAEVDQLEAFHDAQLAREEALHLFNLGYCSLAYRSLADRLYFAIAATVLREMRDQANAAEQLASQHQAPREQPLGSALPSELAELEQVLAETYVCNCSIFQSLPDSWAIDQLFPIMPIHRLNEPPSIRATLADITCDSDGRIDNFISEKQHRPVIDLHPWTDNPDEQYLLGAFLVGAYQETLGDLHNLFGDTHAVHVSLDAGGNPSIDKIVKGDKVSDVLEFVQFNAEQLGQMFNEHTDHAAQEGKLTQEEAHALQAFYNDALEGYTYLK